MLFPCKAKDRVRDKVEIKTGVFPFLETRLILLGFLYIIKNFVAKTFVM